MSFPRMVFLSQSFQTESKLTLGLLGTLLSFCLTVLPGLLSMGICKILFLLRRQRGLAWL